MRVYSTLETDFTPEVDGLLSGQNGQNREKDCSEGRKGAAFTVCDWARVHVGRKKYRRMA
ncbi:MAG: hypothetical protein D3910_14505 [Candidatus Electrothrix sp. ATG2]|nr:hypothetical protein [Candidatus Electrothrix sp. ATG2]